MSENHRHEDDAEETGRSDDAGQVSEVQQMPETEADTPISDSQSVHGHPDADSGPVQEGPAGPDAKVPGADDEHPEVTREDG